MRYVKYLLIILIPLLLGAFYALYSIRNATNLTDSKVYNGSWRVTEKMDLANNLFQRAVVSRIGLLALRETEVLYLEAGKDDKGRPLESQYDYEIVGKNLDTRYWSFTLYGEDFFLIDNETNKYGINLDRITYHQIDSTTGEKHFKFYLSEQVKPFNWIPTGEKNQRLYITFRLYNPAPSVCENLKTIELPVIRRIEKKRGGAI